MSKRYRSELQMNILNGLMVEALKTLDDPEVRGVIEQCRELDREGKQSRDQICARIPPEIVAKAKPIVQDHLFEQDPVGTARHFDRIWGLYEVQRELDRGASTRLIHGNPYPHSVLPRALTTDAVRTLTPLGLGHAIAHHKARKRGDQLLKDEHELVRRKGLWNERRGEGELGAILD